MHHFTAQSRAYDCGPLSLLGLGNKVERRERKFHGERWESGGCCGTEPNFPPLIDHSQWAVDWKRTGKA
jgi:hypothetical protein